MTQETRIIIVFIILAAIAVCVVLWLLSPSASSHRGATEPSRLPPPPQRDNSPWYLRICYFPSAQCPDIYLQAHDIDSIVGDPKTHKLIVMRGDKEAVFNNVERYSFVQMSQMGDWLITEEDLEQPEEL